MDDLRFGAALRAVRLEQGLRQVDVARRAGVSQVCISRLERGAATGMTFGSMRSDAGALGVRVELEARWRGAELDRLLAARHSAMHEAVSRWLRAFPRWEFVPEASYALGGERGVIDILG